MIIEPEKDDIIVDEYKDEDENEIKKTLINVSQVSSIHNRIAIRSKASNYEEMVLAFEFYLEKIGLFTQSESIEMKTSFFSIIDHIEYKQYTILIPIFFIYAYCLSKEIAFPKSLKKRIAIEVYTKKTCYCLMEKYVAIFCKILGVKVTSNYNWNFYIRGFLMMIRSVISNIGCDERIKSISSDDENFLQNTYDMSSYLRETGKVVKLESYRLLAIGMIKNNFFNSIDLDHIFDLQVRALLIILTENNIITPLVSESLTEMFQTAPPNMKLLNMYRLERESYINSQITEESVMKKYILQ